MCSPEEKKETTGANTDSRLDWHNTLKVPQVDMVAHLIEVDLDSVVFHPTLELVNRTPRFSLPIPNLGEAGELLVVPSYDPQRGGEVIKTNEDGSTARGLVFLNPKDGGIYQAVKGDGTKVLIFNDITAEIASKLMEKITNVQPEIDKISLPELKEIVRFATDELGITDIFNAKRSQIIDDTAPFEGFPLPTDSGGQPIPYFGYRLVSKDIRHRVALIGITVGGDRGKRYVSDAVVVDDGKHRWCIARDVVERNFNKIADFGESVVEIPLTSLREEFGL